MKKRDVVVAVGGNIVLALTALFFDGNPLATQRLGNCQSGECWAAQHRLGERNFTQSREMCTFFRNSPCSRSSLRRVVEIQSHPFSRHFRVRSHTCEALFSFLQN